MLVVKPPILVDVEHNNELKQIGHVGRCFAASGCGFFTLIKCFGPYLV